MFLAFFSLYEPFSKKKERNTTYKVKSNYVVARLLEVLYICKEVKKAKSRIFIRTKAIDKLITW